MGDEISVPRHDEFVIRTRVFETVLSVIAKITASFLKLEQKFVIEISRNPAEARLPDGESSSYFSGTVAYGPRSP